MWLRLLLVASLAGWTVAVAAPPPDYAREVHPLLVARCSTCHGPANSMANLSIATLADMLKAGVIVPGKAAESKLIGRIDGTHGPRMPMGGAPLTAEEIDLLRRWIDAGASGEVTPTAVSWTPPLAPRQVTLPNSPKANPIDKLLTPYFAKQQKQPGAVVSDALFARRAYLDLWGLLPPPDALNKFVADTTPGKRAKLVAALLANRQNYAEHWITFWNDLLHNDEGITYAEPRPSISPWLMQSLSSNLPYDQFVATLLNPVKKEDPVGFVQGVMWRGEINASQTQPMQAAQNSAQVFLGVNLKCNSCHDSFISHWKLKESYGLASFFSAEPLELVRCDVKTGKMAKAEFLFPELGSVPDGATLPEKHTAAASFFTKKQNGRFARTYVNRIWRTLFGRGLVEPIDDMDAEPWNADLLDWLAADFADHGFDTQRLLAEIMTSEAYQLPSVPRGTGTYVFQGPYYRRLSSEQFMDAASTFTGEWRIKQANRQQPGPLAREWQFKSTNLSRMLGRPVRDFAVTERQNDPSTLQTLELVNGDTLARLLRRGSQRIEKTLKPAPEPIWFSVTIRAIPSEIDVDVTGLDELHLVLVNQDSYDLNRVKAAWVSDIVPGERSTIDFKDQPPREAVIAKVPSEIVVDLRGKNITRFKATVGVDKASLASDINAAIRAYVFKTKPDYESLFPAKGEPPVPPTITKENLVDGLYQYALSRKPTDEERRIAQNIVAQPNGVEDLLWCILMLPEFQYIR